MGIDVCGGAVRGLAQLSEAHPDLETRYAASNGAHPQVWLVLRLQRREIERREGGGEGKREGGGERYEVEKEMMERERGSGREIKWE